MKRLTVILAAILLLPLALHAQNGASGAIVNSAVNCGTDIDGQMVGVGNPPTTTSVTSAFSGTLPAGTYYVQYNWYDWLGKTTQVSPEQTVSLTGTGSITVNPPTSGLPENASGMGIYIGSTPGGETLQGRTSSVNSWVQSVPLTAGVNPPQTNTTQCKIVANDALWPSGTGYQVTMQDNSGNVYPGYPMQWQLQGPGTTINVGQGLPYYHGVTFYPTPILASPLNHSTQSISGSLSLGSYTLYAGALNIGGNSVTPVGVHGTIVAGDCASWFNSTLIQDAGAPCGSGGGGGSGTVTSVSVTSTVAPYFTTTVTNPTTTPAIGITASTIPADNILGNPTSLSAVPTTELIPACPDDGAHALVYVSHAWVCAAISGAGTTYTGSGITVYSGYAVSLSGTQYAPFGGGASTLTATAAASGVYLGAEPVVVAHLCMRLSGTLGVTQVVATLYDGSSAESPTVTVTSTTPVCDDTHSYTTSANSSLSIQLVSTGSGTPNVIIDAQVGTGGLTGTGINTELTFWGGSTVLESSSDYTLTSHTLAGGSSAILDMHSAASEKVPVAASLTTSAAGQIGDDSSTGMYHVYANGVDSLVITVPEASLPTNNDCAQFSVSGGVVTLADAGSPCGTGSGGSGTVAAGTVGQLAAYTGSTTVSGTSAVTVSGSTVSIPGLAPGSNYVLPMVASTTGTLSQSNFTDTGSGSGAGFYAGSGGFSSVTLATAGTTAGLFNYGFGSATAQTGTGVDISVASSGTYYEMILPANATTAPVDYTLKVASVGAGPTETLKFASALVDAGAKFTTNAGCSESSLTGGAATGSFVAGATSCSTVITFGITAPNGWICHPHDLTHPTDAITQTAKSTTTATIGGTVTSADVIQFSCEAY